MYHRLLANASNLFELFSVVLGCPPPATQEASIRGGRDAARAGRVPVSRRLILLIVTLGALGRREEAAQAAHRYLQIQPDFCVSSYARRCPFRGAALEAWLGHLRSAGLPD